MATTIYNQLLTDIHKYALVQFKLLQVKTVKQLSQITGMIIAAVIIITLMIIGLIFAAIALAAWLEYWLPMWASYLVISGCILLAALTVFWCRKKWFIQPLETQLSDVILDDTTPLDHQKQAAEYQSIEQQQALQQDIRNIKQDWILIDGILQLIKGH